MERRSWPWKRKSSEKASGSSLSNGRVKQGGQRRLSTEHHSNHITISPHRLIPIKHLRLLIRRHLVIYDPLEVLYSSLQPRAPCPYNSQSAFPPTASRPSITTLTTTEPPPPLQSKPQHHPLAPPAPSCRSPPSQSIEGSQPPHHQPSSPNRPSKQPTGPTNSQQPPSRIQQSSFWPHCHLTTALLLLFWVIFSSLSSLCPLHCWPTSSDRVLKIQPQHSAGPLNINNLNVHTLQKLQSPITSLKNHLQQAITVVDASSIMLTLEDVFGGRIDHTKFMEWNCLRKPKFQVMDLNEHTKPAKSMQISVEEYEHLNGLEGLVEVLHEKLDDMKEKLSSAQADSTTKDELVKQHAKVAEEAISGWEKAEAETLALKHQLESVTFQKLTAEEGAAHLDSALKECMRQIHNVKEESEQKLHDVVFSKTQQWEKVKSELEATIAGFEQELMKSSAEIAILSRSLQEYSMLLMKTEEEKAKADGEIEVLKTNIQSNEREISSLKYELNVATKEVEIRNEEKNMSVKSAEVANKQHIKDVKKITKLEAVCQRLRGLVRKRLPGPAALAQMKLEVESFGQDFGESRVSRQSGNKSLSPYPVLAPEITVYEVEHYHKENEFLTARLLAMEEEAKVLKESLSKRNSELHASRSTCAKTANKLRNLEVQILSMNGQKNSLKSNADILVEGSSSQNEGNQSLTSMYEDGIDDERSCVESWASALILELSRVKKNKDSNASKMTHNSNQLELMDDFLEMERLVGMPMENNEAVSVSDEPVKNKGCEGTASVDVHMDVCEQETLGLKQHSKLDLLSRNQPLETLLSKIQLKIAYARESEVLDAKIQKLLEEIMKIVKDAQDELSPCSNMEAQCSLGGIADRETSLKQDDMRDFMIQELKIAISWIHDFVLSLYNEVTQDKSTEVQATRERVEEFSESVNKYFNNNLNLDSFIVSLYHVLYEIKELRLKTWDSSTDCIDKVTLLENGVARHDPMEEKLYGDHDLSHSASDPQVVEGPTNPTSESKTALKSFSLEEFENLKIEKDNMAVNLSKCKETLELTKVQLAETEQKIEELKQQLSSTQKSNDLTETQLRCMTGSYKSLESRAQELESEVNLLRAKVEALENELSAERHSHQDDLVKYNDLHNHMRSMSRSMCSCHSAAVSDTKEREIASTAEMLVACQDTIILLTKQLNVICPTVEQASMSSHFGDESSLVFHSSQQSHYPSIENYAVSMSLGAGVESPLDEYNSQFSSSDIESSPMQEPSTNSKHQKHRSRSESTSSLSNMLNDKQRRGISRFFSKSFEKNEH